MREAMIVGGSGMIGRAAAQRLLHDNWSVRIVGRDPAHLPTELRDSVAFAVADRDDPAALAAALGTGVDLVVDCVCFTARQAHGLVSLLHGVGSAVVISSKAVYADDAGRHSNSAEPPVFDRPVRETQRTVAPDDRDDYDGPQYGACKVGVEQVVLEAGQPVTVLRPSKVHGVGAAQPREWAFVKRVLDGRALLPLAHQGRSGDHTSAAANIAELVAVAAEHPGCRVLNAADPDALTALDIATAIGGEFGHEWDLRLLPDDADPALGTHPWNRWPKVELDLSAACALGYRPAGDYRETVAPMLRWLADIAQHGSDGWTLPESFDLEGFERYAGPARYAAEDAAFS